MHIAHFPRIHLAHLPTPLEHLPHLSEHFGGPSLYIKRDDCTGLASGGKQDSSLLHILNMTAPHFECGLPADCR